MCQPLDKLVDNLVDMQIRFLSFFLLIPFLMTAQERPRDYDIKRLSASRF